MSEIHVGQIVIAQEDGLKGRLSEIKDDGTAVIELKSGACVTYPLSGLVADETPVGPAMDGHFQPGHPYYGKNPDNEKARRTVKEIQEGLRSGMADLLLDAPNLIRSIPSSEKKINAMAKIAPFCMPALARVDVEDNGKRDLSVEQRLMEFGLAYLEGKKSNN